MSEVTSEKKREKKSSKSHKSSKDGSKDHRKKKTRSEKEEKKPEQTPDEHEDKEDSDDEPFERDLSRLLRDDDADLTPEQRKQKEIQQMLLDGWVLGPEGMVGPPRRPPPIPPKSTSIPGIYSKTEYDTSHMWNTDLQDDGNEAQEEEDKIDFTGTPVAEKYEIGDELGSGGTSVVRVAKEKSSGKEFVVKAVTTDTNSLPNNAWKNTVKNIEHCQGSDRVVKIHETLKDGDNQYIVLERYVGPVTSVVRKGDAKWTEKDACRVVTQLLEALEFIHSKGLTHGDITPSNILAVDDKVTAVRLGGFAKANEGENDGDLFCDGSYKAPEVLERKKHDKSVDMWALGCVTYLFLTGKLPFSDKNMMRLNMNIKKGTYTAVETSDDKAKKFVESLLNVDPSKRPTPAAALQHDWIKSGGADVAVSNFQENLKSTLS